MHEQLLLENKDIELPELPPTTIGRSFDPDFVERMACNLLKYISSLIDMYNNNELFMNDIKLYDTMTIFLNGWSFLNQEVRSIGDNGYNIIKKDTKIESEIFEVKIYLQEEKCPLCGQNINNKQFIENYCNYTHLYYCNDCISEPVNIPSKILSNYDFHKYKVCKPVNKYINYIFDQPLFDMTDFDDLPSKIKEDVKEKFNRINRLKLQMFHTYSIVSTCPAGLEVYNKYICS